MSSALFAAGERYNEKPVQVFSQQVSNYVHV